MLVRRKCIAGTRGLQYLCQQHVGMWNQFSGCKWPIRTYAFAFHIPGADNAWVCITTGRNKSPQPRQRRGQDEEQSDNTVRRIFDSPHYIGKAYDKDRNRIDSIWPKATGITEDADMLPAMIAALDLRPQAKKVAVFLASNATGDALASYLNDQAALFSTRTIAQAQKLGGLAAFIASTCSTSSPHGNGDSSP